MICKILSKNPLHNLTASSLLAPTCHSSIADDCGVTGPSLEAQTVKDLPACNAGDLGSIPGSGIAPGEGNGYPLQYSCLENSMDRGVWWATVRGV